MSTTTIQKEDVHLSVWKRLCYGSVDAGGMFAFSMVSSYLTVFYTDVVGLTPSVISIIMLIARIWDGINDPMMGVIAEKTRTKWGRYRPYLLFGSPILGIFTVLTFTRPTWTGFASVLYCGVTYILCGMAYTATGIAGTALANVLTRDNQERMILISFRSAMSTIATLITGAATMPLILRFGDGNPSSAKGYFWAVVIFACIGTVFYWIAFAGTREVIAPDESKASGSVLESMKLAFGDANIRNLLIGYLLYMCGVFFRLGVMVYFFLYVVEQPLWLSIAATVMTISMATPTFIVPFLTSRFEKKHLMMAFLVFGAIGGVLLFLGGTLSNLFMILTGTALFHGSGGAVGTISYGLVAEIVDDMEVRTGSRADAIVLSVTSFAVKLGNALAGSVGVVLLSAVGYVANEVQSAATKTGMNVIINLVPAVLFVVAFIPFAMIKMSREKAAENQRILMERHAGKAEEE